MHSLQYFLTPFRRLKMSSMKKLQQRILIIQFLATFWTYDYNFIRCVLLARPRWLLAVHQYWLAVLAKAPTSSPVTLHSGPQLYLWIEFDQVLYRTWLVTPIRSDAFTCLSIRCFKTVLFWMREKRCYVIFLTQGGLRQLRHDIDNFQNRAGLLMELSHALCTLLISYILFSKS